MGPLEIGAQAKRTGKRYVNDQNIGVFQCAAATGASVNASNNVCPVGSTTYQVYSAATPAYTLVDFDARLALDWVGLNDRTYLQLNLVNAFDKLYVGGFGGNTSAFNIPNSQIGSPRAFIATLNVAL